MKFLAFLAWVVWGSAFSSVYDVHNTSAIYADLEGIYQSVKEIKGPDKVKAFEKKLDELIAQIVKEHKTQEGKEAINIITTEVHDPAQGHGELHQIMEKAFILLDDDLDPSDQEIATYLATSFTERLNSSTNTAQALSAADLKGKRRHSVNEQFEALKLSDFRQTAQGGACALYSFLYAVLHTEGLKEKLMSLVSQDSQGVYYVKEKRYIKKGPKREKGVTFFAVTKKMMSQAQEDMHPSDSPILRALGFFAHAQFVQEIGNISFTNYVLSIDGRDIFFNHKVVEIHRKELIDFYGADAFKDLSGEVFLKNGTIEILGYTYKGPFVVSIGTGQKSGHAIAAFYDATTKEWKLYNNLQDKVESIDKLALYSITSMQIIGNFHVTRTGKVHSK